MNNIRYSSVSINPILYFKNKNGNDLTFLKEKLGMGIF